MASASGVTFVASSGDQGSADCTSGSGTPLRLLSVNYPSSSWWVTGVGRHESRAERRRTRSRRARLERRRRSARFCGRRRHERPVQPPELPAGQHEARTAGQCPDVSMLSDIAPGYAIYCSAADANCISDVNHNPWEALGGTSAATPLLAGGFAIVNQQLRAAHEHALGLVNPLLYSLSRSHAPGVFFDVTRYGNDIGPDIGNHKALGCCRARRRVRPGVGDRQRQRRRVRRRGAGAGSRPWSRVRASVPRGPASGPPTRAPGDGHVHRSVPDGRLRARLDRPGQGVRGQLLRRAADRCRKPDAAAALHQPRAGASCAPRSLTTRSSARRSAACCSTRRSTACSSDPAGSITVAHGSRSS